MQCAATAATAVGTAAGLRAWIRGHAGAWLTEARLRGVTIALATGAVIASGVALGGTG
jgi:hypothetical protein